jgi:hypothetical protein
MRNTKLLLPLGRNPSDRGFRRLATKVASVRSNRAVKLITPLREEVQEALMSEHGMDTGET